MVIRRANEGDLDRVNDLLRQVLELHAAGRPDIFTSGRKKYTNSELLEIFDDESSPVYVAEDDGGRVVGYAFCIYKITENDNILRDRKTLYIDDLCVDADCRGQHIGTRLFEHVKGVAKESGCQSITLNVWTLNESAMRFYGKCGFSPLKTVMESIL